MDRTPPAYTLTPAEVAEAQGVDVELGLSAAEAAERLERWGPNRPRRRRRPAYVRLAVRQLADPLVGLLLAATAVSFAIGDHLEAAAIAAVIVVNAVLGYRQELAADRAVLALSEAFTQRAVVVREGVEREIAADEVVPGDLLVLREGDRVAADARVSHILALEVEEAALTGESLPVEKTSEPVPAAAPLAERVCMVYAGTAVVRGHGRALVCATGERTELGQIEALAAAAKPPPTPLERRLGQLSRQMVLLGAAITVGLAGAMLLRGAALHSAFLVGVAVAVAAVPEGLAATVTAALALGAQAMARRGAIVRRLDAIETLGETTVVCTDKTGTLTENRIRLAVLRAAPHATANDVLEAAVLACSARESGDGVVHGDPIERALLLRGDRARHLAVRSPRRPGARPRGAVRLRAEADDARLRGARQAAGIRERRAGSRRRPCARGVRSPAPHGGRLGGGGLPRPRRRGGHARRRRSARRVGRAEPGAARRRGPPRSAAGVGRRRDRGRGGRRYRRHDADRRPRGDGADGRPGARSPRGRGRRARDSRRQARPRRGAPERRRGRGGHGRRRQRRPCAPTRRRRHRDGRVRHRGGARGGGDRAHRRRLRHDRRRDRGGTPDRRQHPEVRRLSPLRQPRRGARLRRCDRRGSRASPRRDPGARGQRRHRRSARAGAQPGSRGARDDDLAAAPRHAALRPPLLARSRRHRRHRRCRHPRRLRGRAGIRRRRADDGVRDPLALRARAGLRRPLVLDGGVASPPKPVAEPERDRIRRGRRARRVPAAGARAARHDGSRRARDRGRRRARVRPAGGRRAGEAAARPPPAASRATRPKADRACSPATAARHVSGRGRRGGRRARACRARHSEPPVSSASQGADPGRGTPVPRPCSRRPSRPPRPPSR